MDSVIIYGENLFFEEFAEDLRKEEISKIWGKNKIHQNSKKMLDWSYFTTSAKPKFLLVVVILILTSSPTLAPETKTTKPSIRAIPSPSLPTSSILTSYSSPSLMGEEFPLSP